MVRQSAPATAPGETWEAPDKWLLEIEKLRDQGRLEEARKSLGDFRKRYPNHPVPAFLQDALAP
jgi:hypothetical protein